MSVKDIFLLQRRQGEMQILKEYKKRIVRISCVVGIALTWFRQATWVQPSFQVEITSLPPCAQARADTGPGCVVVVVIVLVFAAAFQTFLEDVTLATVISLRGGDSTQFIF